MKTRTEVRQGLLTGLDRWRDSLNSAYDEVQQAIEEERWEDVNNLMAKIAQQTAQAGLNLRRVLMKNNLMEDE